MRRKIYHFKGYFHKTGLFFLFITLFIFLLLRLPSLFEPYWYGDEGIYQVIGRALRAGRDIYLGAWDNKPPLLLYLYALFWGDQFQMKLLSLIFGIFSVIIFFFIGKKLFLNKKTVYITTFAFSILLGSPLIEGNIANTENFMLLPILIGIFLIFYAVKKKFFLFFVAGGMLSIAFLFKVVALFDTLAVISFIIFSRQMKTLFPLIVGFSIPIFLTVFYFLTYGLFIPFFEALLLSNIGYVGYRNYFINPYGFMVVKILLLIGSLSIIFIRRKTINYKKLFVMIWFSFSLFNVFFSGRDYEHYLLLLSPSYSLILGFIVEQKKKFMSSILQLTFITLLLVFYFGAYGNTIWYYTNFIFYKSKYISETAYKNFFDPYTSSNYVLADYIKTHTLPHQNIFVWGNNPQIYILSDKLPPGRFSVAYHIVQNNRTLNETKKELSESIPFIIIILPNTPSYPFDLRGYIEKDIIDGAVIYEREKI